MPVRRNLLLTIALAGAVGAAARWGAWLALVPGPVAGDWLAAGLGLAVLMAWGRRAIAGVALGLFAAHALVAVDAAGALVAAGVLAQALLAAWALRSLPTQLPLNPVRQTLRFALVVSACGVVAASVGLLANPGAASLSAWGAGWLGDVAGMLVLTPSLLVLLDARLRADRVTLQPFPLICLGLGLTAFCTFAVGLGARDAQTERFRADAGRLAMTLQTHVELTARDLETLQRSSTRSTSTPPSSARLHAAARAQPVAVHLRVAAARDIAAREAFETAPAGAGRHLDPRDRRAGRRRARRPRATPSTRWRGRTPNLAARPCGGSTTRTTRSAAARSCARSATEAMTSTPPLSSVANSPEGRLVQSLYAPVGIGTISTGWPSAPVHVRGVVAATLDLAALLQGLRRADGHARAMAAAVRSPTRRAVPRCCGATASRCRSSSPSRAPPWEDTLACGRHRAPRHPRGRSPLGDAGRVPRGPARCRARDGCSCRCSPAAWPSPPC